MRIVSRLVLAASLAVSLASTPSPGVSAVPSVPSAVPAGSAANDVLYTRYAASFTAKVTLDQSSSYGSGDYSRQVARVKVAGTVPNVRFADDRFVSGYGRGRLTTSGFASRDRARDSGAVVTTCKGESVSPAGPVPPTLVPVGGQATLFAYHALSAPVVCTSSDDPTPRTEVMGLPAIPVPVTIPRSKIGATTFKVPLNHKVPVADCPGYEENANDYCFYDLVGTLTLRLVPDIDVFQAPTKARLARAAARASTVAACGAACTATLTVRPLVGTGSARTRESLRPRRPETLAVVLDQPLLASIVRNGGARFEVTYRTGGVTRTFRQTVRL